ncbi:hypothetical protein ACQ4PT_011322 [Festuca glaucescens]
MEGGGFNKSGSPEESGGSRRAQAYYECSFCKRGFTNAQALGGHMNIHRKDRGVSAGKSRGAAPPAAGQQDGAGADHEVHLGLTLGRNGDSREDVDLELRLGHYPYN